jgi:enamine deaminase RidA (YjgF/YER057c/UK114 family)
MAFFRLAFGREVTYGSSARCRVGVCAGLGRTREGQMDLAVSSFVFMTDLGDFPKMNAIYAEYFTKTPPGRTTVEVKGLPAGAHVEITVTALAGPVA